VKEDAQKMRQAAEVDLLIKKRKDLDQAKAAAFVKKKLEVCCIIDILDKAPILVLMFLSLIRTKRLQHLKLKFLVVSPLLIFR
jgi:hypothetical protein